MDKRTNKIPSIEDIKNNTINTNGRFKPVLADNIRYPTYYCYNENIINKVNEDFITIGLNEIDEIKSNEDTNNKKGTKKLLDNTIKGIYNDIRDMLYIIYPNPTDNLHFLVYEETDVIFDKKPEGETIKICSFMKLDDSTEINKDILREQYNKIDKTFRSFYPFEKFIKNLPVYRETKRNGYNVLLADGYIYDYDNFEFTYATNKIPFATTELKYTEITEKDYSLLDKYFHSMYPNIETYKQYLLFIAVSLNKDLLKQIIFVNIDDSGIGKNARLNSTCTLKLNENANPSILKPTELYNIANKNMVIFNEISKTKIDGTILRMLADTEEHKVTVKNRDAITIPTEDKPVITIIGENMPLIEAFDNGNVRRFLLVPKVAKGYFNMLGTKEAKEFYNILYHKPFEVLMYYLSEIKKYDIIKFAEEISKGMKVTVEDISKLCVTNDEIFNRFFNTEAIKKKDIISVVVLKNDYELDKLLNLINKEYIKTNHFNNIQEAKKYLDDMIKENTEVTNLNKEIGYTSVRFNDKTVRCKLCYQLTNYAIKEIDKYNKTVSDNDKILYKTYSSDTP